MEDAVQMTCFGRSIKSKKNNNARNKGNTKAGPSLKNISPLSSVNSEEVIKAHRLDLTEAGKEKVDFAAELSRERALRQNLEEQLAAALNINAELKLSLMLKEEEGSGKGLLSQKLERLRGQLNKERKEKEGTEHQLAAAKREAAAMRAALNAARQQRDDLEAELMEAALDVMDSEKQHAKFEVMVKNEGRSKEVAEAATAEAESLRHKLQVVETAREALEQKLAAMSQEASEWELALDALQEQLETALLHRPLESIKLPKFDAYAPPTPPQGRQGVNESTVNVDVAVRNEPKNDVKDDELKDELKPAPKAEPWRQVVVRPRFIEEEPEA